MHVRTILVYVCAAGLVAACKLTNPVPVEPDYPPDPPGAVEEPDGSPAALASPCGKACSRFAKLGCPEAKPSGNGTSCYLVCVRAAKLRKIPAACWAGASSVDDLRACGGVRCVP